MDIPTYAQRDPRWANQLINNVAGSTIGHYGCTISCIAMISGRNPGEQETLMRTLGAFQDDLVIWGKTPGFKSRFTCEMTPAPLEDIKAEIRAGRPVLANVKLGANLAKPNHWVLVIDENFTIDDPWYGDKQPIQMRYGNPETAIYGGAYFNPQTDLNPQPAPVQTPTNINIDDMSQADKDRLAKYDQIAGKMHNEAVLFKAENNDALYMDWHIDSPDTLTFLGLDWGKLVTLPADWPLDPKDWAGQRQYLQPQLDAEIAKAAAELADSKDRVIAQNLKIETPPAPVQKSILQSFIESIFGKK